MFRIANGRVRLTVAPEFGCRWMRLERKIGGRWIDVIVPARSLARLRKDPFFDGAYLMAPWCNRIPKGRFRFRGREHRLDPNFPDGTAIHGDVFGRRWSPERKSAAAFSARLDSRGAEGFNFPWPVVVRHGARLTARGVSAWITVRNAGTEPCPVGAGFHPFFPRAIEGSEAALAVPARRTGPVGQARYDDSLPWDGATVRAAYAGAGMEIRLSGGKNARHLFMWTPSRFRGKKAAFFCAEPMTMKAGGFPRTARVLKAGGTLRISWRLEAV